MKENVGFKLLTWNAEDQISAEKRRYKKSRRRKNKKIRKFEFRAIFFKSEVLRCLVSGKMHFLPLYPVTGVEFRRRRQIKWICTSMIIFFLMKLTLIFMNKSFLWENRENTKGHNGEHTVGEHWESNPRATGWDPRMLPLCYASFDTL